MTFFNVFIALIYFVGFILCIIGFLRKSTKLGTISNIFIVSGYIGHTIILLLTIFNGVFLSKGQFYFSLFGWSLIFVFLFLILKMKMRFLSLIIAPIAFIFFICSFFITTKQLPVPKTMSMLWFGTHIFSLFLSISLSGIGFAVGVFYLYLHNKIKNKSASGYLNGEGVSLETLDRINHFVVSLGFPLFTIGIVSGFIWARLTWHKVFSWDIKEIWSIFIWLLFAYLFHQRLAIGWKGKKPAIVISWIFFFSVVSFFVINFLFPTHHKF